MPTEDPGNWATHARAYPLERLPADMRAPRRGARAPPALTWLADGTDAAV
ncbi:hypothetical protein AB0I81_00280 [Nonomuraea sp. NPDC050404]